MSDYDDLVKRLRGEYTAWLCFSETGSIRACDSDTPGAFKVYRWEVTEDAIKPLRAEIKNLNVQLERQNARIADIENRHPAQHQEQIWQFGNLKFTSKLSPF